SSMTRSAGWSTCQTPRSRMPSLSWAADPPLAYRRGVAWPSGLSCALMKLAKPLSDPMWLTCVNPTTGVPGEKVPIRTPDDVRRVVEEARAAQARLASASLRQRSKLLLRLRALLLERSEELCALIASVSGKTREHALVGEIWPMCEKLTWTATQGPH